MSKWKNKNFYNALKNSLSGIKCVYKSERNIKIQSIIAFIAILFSIFFKLSIIEFIVVVLLIFIVFISEFFNTSIEECVNMISEEYSEKAKIVKDVSSAAVLLSAVQAIIIGMIIFLPKLINLIK